MTAPCASAVVVVRGADQIAFLLQPSSSFRAAGIAPPLATAAAARRATHRSRHSVDASVLAPKDACALLRRDLTPDPSSLSLGPLRRNCTRNGRSGTKVPRRSSPEDGEGSGAIATGSCPSGPLHRSGEYGSAPSPSPFNAPSQSQSPQVDPLERAGSTSSVSAPASGNASSLSFLPRGSEVDGSSSHRRPRPNSYDEFGV
jgi:hypothetical protein